MKTKYGIGDLIKLKNREHSLLMIEDIKPPDIFSSQKRYCMWNLISNDRFDLDISSVDFELNISKVA